MELALTFLSFEVSGLPFLSASEPGIMVLGRDEGAVRVGSMQRRLFDHIDLRVRSLAESGPFYAAFLPAIGFPDFCETSIGVAYDARRAHPKPEFIGLIEDPEHRPNATRLAFWAESVEEVDRIARVVVAAGGRNIEGPMACPEYSTTYYGLFFEDPCGNRLEVCCRTAKL